MLELMLSAVCFGILWLIVTLMNASEKNDRDIHRSLSIRTKQQLSKKGKVKYFDYFKNDEYFAIVDNFLHVNINGRKGKTNINNIMTTEIKYHVSEKNRMRFMAVMPTFDKYTRLVKIELILYRKDRDDVNFVLDPSVVSDQSIKKLKMILDEIIEEGKVSDKS